MVQEDTLEEKDDKENEECKEYRSMENNERLNMYISAVQLFPTDSSRQ